MFKFTKKEVSLCPFITRGCNLPQSCENGCPDVHTKCDIYNCKNSCTRTCYSFIEFQKTDCYKSILNKIEEAKNDRIR